MLNSKQRAQLKSSANTIDTIFQVGKGGINEQLIRQIDETLEVRELIKARVLNTCDSSVAETAAQIAEQTSSDVVQVIGSKFVLYRQNKKENKFNIKF